MKPSYGFWFQFLGTFKSTRDYLLWFQIENIKLVSLICVMNHIFSLFFCLKERKIVYFVDKGTNEGSAETETDT